MKIFTYEEFKLDKKNKSTCLIVDKKIKMGDVEYADGVLLKNSELVYLTREEAKFLRYLFDKEDLVSNDELGKEVFNKKMLPQSIYRFVAAINKKTCSGFIVNSYGKGYSFGTK